VFENLEAGMSLAEITEVFDVTPEEVKAVLHFASESLLRHHLEKPMQSVIKIPRDLARELDLLAQAEHKRRTPYVVDLLWRDVRRNSPLVRGIPTIIRNWPKAALLMSRKSVPKPTNNSTPPFGRPDGSHFRSP